MAKYFDVKLTLVSQLKNCPAGHKVGDEFIVGHKTPEGLCLGAFGSLLPFIQALKFGGNFFWEKQEGVATICCPDPEVVNTFRLERVPAAEPADDGHDG